MTDDTPRDPLAALPYLTRYINHGGGMAPDPEGQWVHIGDVTNVETWNLDPATRPSGDEALRAAAKRVAAFPYQANDPEGRYALADLRDV